jgi:hypothetical protein
VSDIVKKNLLNSTSIVDGFAGWEEATEGDDRPQGGGLIQGILIKFTNEAQWVTRDGEKLPADLKLVAVDIARVVQKWRDQQPVETIILESHQKFPDIEQMNEETPHDEWVEGPDRKPRGPWQGQHVLYLLDATSLQKYTFPTGTVGGRWAIRDLREKTVWMRRVKNETNIYAVVTLSDIFMNTRFGGRQRPDFVIQRWVRLGGEGGEVEALSPAATNNGALAKPAGEPASQTDLPLTEVKEPTLAEDMGDSIPDFDEPVVAKPETVNVPKTTARRTLNKPSPAKTSARASSRRRLSDAG